MRCHHAAKYVRESAGPSVQSSGMVQKMMIDATTPIAPDKRGHHGELLESPNGTDVWQKKLEALIRELQK